MSMVDPARKAGQERAALVRAAFGAPNYDAFRAAYGVEAPTVVRRLYDTVRTPVAPFNVTDASGSIALEVQGLLPLWAESIERGRPHGWRSLVIGTQADGGELLLELASGLLFVNFPDGDTTDPTDVSVDDLLAALR